MQDPQARLVDWAVRIASILPSGSIQALAQAIATSAASDWSGLRRRLVQIAPQPHLRALVLEMHTTWREQAIDVQPIEVALMLRTADAATRALRESQAVDLVWSGPLISSSAMRRTDQALLQLITSAQQSLLIVSFAVYKIPAIATAIVQAAARGVTIRICVEAPDPSGQKMAYDTLKALGPQVARHAAIYVWPSEQRPADARGNVGVLHAKCAVADERLLFISSANLTDHAMNLNMELGVLVRSTTHGASVVAQFEQLIAHGILQRVPLEA